MATHTIDVNEGVQDVFVGESVSLDIDTKGSVAGEGIKATPSALGASVLYDETGSDVTATQMNTSVATLSSDTITTPLITPDGVGRYTWLVPMTVSGNTLYQRLKLQVRDATPY